MYNLKMHFNHAFGMGEERVVVQLDNLQERLIDICNQQVSDNHIYSFSTYYGKSDQYAVEEIVPYVLKDGVYNWNVLYSDIAVEDFLKTHNIVESDWIEIDVDNVGSGPVYLEMLYQGWVQFGTIACTLIDWVGRVITVASIVSCVKKSFGKEKKNKPTVKEFYNLVMSKEKWNRIQLEEQLNIDSDFLEPILLIFGFEIDNEGENFIINVEKKKLYLDAETNYFKKLYYNYGTEINCYSINEQIENININLLYASILLENNPVAWEWEREQLADFVENNRYLKIGEDASYISFNNELELSINNEIENQLWIDLQDYNDLLLDRILKYEE